MPVQTGVVAPEDIQLAVVGNWTEETRRQGHCRVAMETSNTWRPATPGDQLDQAGQWVQKGSAGPGEPGPGLDI